MDGEKNEQQSLEGKYSRKYISRKHDLCLCMGPISLINGFCLASWSTAAPLHLLIIKACVGFITYGSFLKPFFSKQRNRIPGFATQGRCTYFSESWDYRKLQLARILEVDQCSISVLALVTLRGTPSICGEEDNSEGKESRQDRTVGRWWKWILV